MTDKESDEIYRALCANNLTAEVAQFLVKLAKDIDSLKERVQFLEPHEEE